MGYNNRMDDVSWHISYLKKDEADPRRHKARCIHFYSGQCGVYGCKCTGSAHCIYYHEMTECDVIKRQELQKKEVEAQRLREDYIRKCQELYNNNEKELIRKKYAGVRVCPICDRKLSDGFCFYCGFDISEKKIVQKAKSEKRRKNNRSNDKNQKKLVDNKASKKKQKDNKTNKANQTKSHKKYAGCDYNVGGNCQVTCFKCSEDCAKEYCLYYKMKH